MTNSLGTLDRRRHHVSAPFSNSIFKSWISPWAGSFTRRWLRHCYEGSNQDFLGSHDYRNNERRAKRMTQIRRAFTARNVHSATGPWGRAQARSRDNYQWYWQSYICIHLYDTLHSLLIIRSGVHALISCYLCMYSEQTTFERTVCHKPCCKLHGSFNCWISAGRSSTWADQGTWSQPILQNALRWMLLFSQMMSWFEMSSMIWFMICGTDIYCE